MLIRPIFLFLLASAVPLGATRARHTAIEATDGTLHVVVDNVRGADGSVHVDLCTEVQFLKDCSIAADVPAHPGTSTVTLTGVQSGRYAAQAFYDENSNHKVDRALFGLPKEGVGFSRDAKIRLSPPKWQEAAINYDGHEQTIRLRLRYFIGPDYTPAKTTATVAR